MESFNPPRFIETEHLLLRPFAEADAPQLYYALFGDPAVTEWLPIKTLESVDEARALIRKMLHGWEQHSCYTWALEDKETGYLSAIIEVRPNLPRLELGAAISMRNTHRRRRAGIVALRKLIDWMIAQPSVHRIYACCSPNAKSAPVMQKLGFELEGRLVNWDARPNRGLEADDVLMFALTRKPAAEQPAIAQNDARVGSPREVDTHQHETAALEMSCVA
ncbi:GNAT family N-acetyltransferase [Trinickia fusca]|uniref:N-acetyltransferase n=1 Tax=Trinickia fusca TaxID=2419777 RepID=A0A494X1J9_9BURK|nr:GNAT family N-acetyltransferase [Trinickia fusca]RKP44597.1 N-acetyltransferase [Trinickia fusca]